MDVAQPSPVAVSVRVGSQLPLPFWLTYYRPGCVTPSLSIGDYKGSVGPDGTAAPEVDLAEGVEETHENELQARWDNFMRSMAEREADGWV